MNVLITGGFGFIGFHLAKKLLEREGTVVTLLDKAMENLDGDLHDLQQKYPSRLFLFRGDLCKGEFPEGEFGEVYHLAAMRGTKYSLYGEQNPYTMLENNITSTMNLINWCRGGKVVFASTGEVHGSLPDGVVPIPTPSTAFVGVSNVYDPRWTYSLSKIVGEMALIHANKDFLWTIVRMQNPYGPRMGEDNVIPKFIRRILSGEKRLEVVTPNDTRPFTYIDDVVDALILCMESSDADGEIVNIASPFEYTIKDIAVALQAASGEEVEIVVPESAETEGERRSLDVTKLQELGWDPDEDLMQGLITTWEWYKDK